MRNSGTSAVARAGLPMLHISHVETAEPQHRIYSISRLGCYASRDIPEAEIILAFSSATMRSATAAVTGCRPDPALLSRICTHIN